MRAGEGGGKGEGEGGKEKGEGERRDRGRGEGKENGHRPPTIFGLKVALSGGAITYELSEFSTNLHKVFCKIN